MRLLDAFLAAFDRPPELDNEAAAEAALKRAFDRALEAHQEFAVRPERFVRFLAGKVRGRQYPIRALEELQVADLYLAYACVEGQREALAKFDRLVLSKAARAALRVDASYAFIDEVRQRVRERLLIASGGSPPRISEYGGSGPLTAWVRITATRVALNMKDVPQRDVPLDPYAMRDPSVTGLESKVLKRYHAADLARAFEAAARALTHEERVLLRYHFVDGLNFEQIAPLFQTHRSTISRKVATAREKLLEGTRHNLARELKLSDSEISSLIQSAQSRMELDLNAWLRTKA